MTQGGKKFGGIESFHISNIIELNSFVKSARGNHPIIGRRAARRRVPSRYAAQGRCVDLQVFRLLQPQVGTAGKAALLAVLAGERQAPVANAVQVRAYGDGACERALPQRGRCQAVNVARELCATGPVHLPWRWWQRRACGVGTLDTTDHWGPCALTNFYEMPSSGGPIVDLHQSRWCAAAVWCAHGGPWVDVRTKQPGCVHGQGMPSRCVHRTAGRAHSPA